MKIGDLVRISAEPSIQQAWITVQVWTIVALKTDARGVWIQLDETSQDIWYASSAYEVINENE